MIGFPFKSVWGTKMRLTLGIAAIAATFAAATPASAQVAADARGTILQPLTLSKTQDLDFGTVVASNTLGTVTINADTGVRTSTGGVTLVGNQGTRGLFIGAANPNSTVTLTVSPVTSLVNQSDNTQTIDVTNFVLDQSDLRIRPMGSNSTFQVGVGATFNIKANQLQGLYRTTFQVTAQYQ
jgi:hypothetical protein